TAFTLADVPVHGVGLQFIIGNIDSCESTDKNYQHTRYFMCCRFGLLPAMRQRGNTDFFVYWAGLPRAWADNNASCIKRNVRTHGIVTIVQRLYDLKKGNTC